MLEKSTEELLLNSKNLLAFSAGVDSTALFFLLLEKNIKFDIAIVDYGVREQSKEEVAYALELASKYKLNCYIHKAEKLDSNFEANARDIRYKFFEEKMSLYKYQNLLTAHHLGDRFEWMLMQFCKGAGCIEMAGMQSIQQRDAYLLVRPLLHLDKQELLEYLNLHKIRYFQDESNTDESYKRNEFRHKHTNPLLQQYLKGIKKSFQYMDADVKTLLHETEINQIGELVYFKSTASIRSDIHYIDQYLKSQQHLTTANERELLKNEKTVIIGRKFVVNQAYDFIFIAPYITKRVFTKEFKEKMRLLKIEPKLRGYLSTDTKAVEFLSLLLA